MDLQTLAMDPYQVHRQQVALLALPCFTLESSVFNGPGGTGPAMPLPETIPAGALPTPPGLTEVSGAVLGLIGAGPHWCWPTHLLSSGIQDSFLNLLTLVTEIFPRSQQLL